MAICWLPSRRALENRHGGEHEFLCHDRERQRYRLGIYDATGPNGGPGQLKAQTAEFTPVSGWNTQNVVSQVLLPAGPTGWPICHRAAAWLSRQQATGSARYYGYTYGPLPATFSTAPKSEVSTGRSMLRYSEGTGE